MITEAELKDLRIRADRPYGERMENPELLARLIGEIERLRKENAALRAQAGT